jgi:hypothetical protein
MPSAPTIWAAVPVAPTRSAPGPVVDVAGRPLGELGAGRRPAVQPVDQPAGELGDEVKQVTTPLLITEPEDEQFWPDQSQALHDLLPGPRELVRFTAAEGASHHCEPMGLAVRDTRVFGWLGRHLTA